MITKGKKKKGSELQSIKICSFLLLIFSSLQLSYLAFYFDLGVLYYPSVKSDYLPVRKRYKSAAWQPLGLSLSTLIMTKHWYTLELETFEYFTAYIQTLKDCNLGM